MKVRWQRLANHFGARSRRERLLVAVLSALGLPLAALVLWVEPGWRAHRILQIEAAQLNSQAERASSAVRIDPNTQARLELQSLQTQLAQQRELLSEQSRRMVSPAEMVPLLETLLAKHPGVRLQALSSLASEPWRGAATAGASALVAPAAAAAGQSGSTASTQPASAAQGIGLYRHGVELELEGPWSALRGYLAEIERSPSQLQWGQLQLSVHEHPLVRMKITLHTLSLEAAWLQL